MRRSLSNDALKKRGYQFLKKIDSGSFATIYLAEYASTATGSQDKEKLACKVIDTRKAPKDFVAKFLPRELNILMRINHPNIIHVQRIFQIGSNYFIFMRFAEMGNLLDFILKHGAIGETQARIWFKQLCSGVMYLHQAQIAHRDLKCENILITANYNLKIADFGFARYSVDADSNPILSETYCGSLSYTAPEILEGRPYDPKMSDVWSLGIILFIVLNKSMPFNDSNPTKLRDHQWARKWKIRSKFADQISTEVQSLLTRLLEPDVTERATIQSILDDPWFF